MPSRRHSSAMLSSPISPLSTMWIFSSDDGRWSYQEKAAEKQDSPAKGKNLGVGGFMAERLKAGDDTAAVLAAVREQFPQSRAGRSDVGIIRRKVKQGVM